MKKSEWDNCLKGFSIVDCAIKNSRVAYVLAVVEKFDKRKKKEEWRVISWSPDVFPEGQTIGKYSFANLRSLPSLAVEGEPYNRLYLADTGGYGYLVGSGDEEAPAIEKLKTFREELYILTFACVYKRNAETNEWEEINLPESLLEDNRSKRGRRRYVLTDFDAFSSDAFYLLDSEGIVLYQESGEWQEVDLKSLGYKNLQTDGICCGPDGWVYIFGKDEKGGKIFQGKGDQWQVIWEASNEIYHIDFVAYQDHVILSNSHMLVKIKDGQIEPFNPPIYCKYLSVRDDLLMIASGSEAAIYDGKEWQVIISPLFDEDGVYQLSKEQGGQERAQTPLAEPETFIWIDYADLIYRFPEFEQQVSLLEGYRFKLYPGDLVIDGDFDPNWGEHTGTVVLGDLIIKGNLINLDDSYGDFLIVGGRTVAENAYLGGSFFGLNEVFIKYICVARLHYGGLSFKKLACPLVIYDEYYHGDLVTAPDNELYFNSEFCESDSRDHGYGLSLLLAAFKGEPWLITDEDEEDEAAEYECVEYDWDVFYEEVICAENGSQSLLNTLRETRDTGKLVYLPATDSADEHITEPYEFYRLPYKKLTEPYQQNGFILRDQLFQLGVALESGELTEAELLVEIDNRFDQFCEQSVQFACTQLVVIEADCTYDETIRPYAFNRLLHRGYPDSIGTCFFMMMSFNSGRMKGVFNALEKQDKERFNRDFLVKILRFSQKVDTEDTRTAPIINAVCCLEMNLGRNEAYDVIDNLLTEAGWEEAHYELLWSLCYRGERDLVVSDAEITRGLTLAFNALTAATGDEEGSAWTCLKAAARYVSKFNHPAVSRWKKQQLNDSDWLQQTYEDKHRRRLKKELVNNFKRA